MSPLGGEKLTFVQKNCIEKAKEKIGAKLLSARLAKVLNLLFTTLTRCLSNARGFVVKSGEIRH